MISFLIKILNLSISNLPKSLLNFKPAHNQSSQVIITFYDEIIKLRIVIKSDNSNTITPITKTLTVYEFKLPINKAWQLYRLQKLTV